LTILPEILCKDRQHGIGDGLFVRRNTLQPPVGRAGSLPDVVENASLLAAGLGPVFVASFLELREGAGYRVLVPLNRHLHKTDV